jgi:tripartite-type tricarboxylate transporter receptor subunit TctC
MHITQVARLNAEFVKAVRSPELKPKLAQQDMEPTGPTAEAFGTAFREELARWTKLAKETGIKAE